MSMMPFANWDASKEEAGIAMLAVKAAEVPRVTVPAVLVFSDFTQTYPLDNPLWVILSVTVLAAALPRTIYLACKSV